MKTLERPKLIKNEKEYNDALERIEEIQDAVPGTPEGDELELLTLLIEKYEEDHYAIKDADPIDVIEYYMEENGLKQKDLVGIIGDKALVSKVMNRERELNLRMIKNLHKELGIPYELIIK
jgi:HTH-type transcriptional regulator/antitoxin HigA